MDRLKQSWPLLLFLGSLMSLAVGFRSFFMTNIIEPIAILCWAVWRIITSVNQTIYWMVLIFVCTLLLIRLIPPGKANLLNPAYTYRRKSPSRVEYWQTLISDAILGNDKTGYLRDNLKQLFLSAFTKIKQSHPMTVEEIIAAGKIPLSLKARHFLFPPDRQGKTNPISRWLDIASVHPKWLPRWAGKFARRDTTAISEILECLETEMEVEHDR
jgi:hypothetical protein